jgi:hypothetical protein
MKTFPEIKGFVMRNSLGDSVAPDKLIYYNTLGSLMQVWVYLISIREQAEKVLPRELWSVVKEECDDLFRQASGGQYKICPNRVIGGFGDRK